MSERDKKFDLLVDSIAEVLIERLKVVSKPRPINQNYSRHVKFMDPTGDTFILPKRLLPKEMRKAPGKYECNIVITATRVRDIEKKKREMWKEFKEEFEDVDEEGVIDPETLANKLTDKKPDGSKSLGHVDLGWSYEDGDDEEIARELLNF